MPNIQRISPQEIQEQMQYVDKVREFYIQRLDGQSPTACIRTFGCQQNVADSERLAGWLSVMGFSFTDNAEEADVIVFNTCAVREHAEDRVFGNVGALKSVRKNGLKPTIVLCGCMMQQPHIAEKIQKSYPFVRLVFGTHRLQVFPKLLCNVLLRDKRSVEISSEEDGYIAEGIPIVRDSKTTAWVSIMYGCNNFCSYCIVPHVRGRERSRNPEDILAEVRDLVAAGYKEITLLGQNVNSYGKSEHFDVDFPELLRRINAIEGDFIIRFMTSHPKDASLELFDTIRDCKKISRHFHLPVQSGSNRILELMNRRYTREQYLHLVEEAKKRVPDIAFTSDILVGFPGETEEDFLETLDLIRQVGYISVYTFIYSKRVGTPAASMPDNTPDSEKVERLSRVVKLQEQIAAEHSKSMEGKVVPVLLESIADGFVEARMNDNEVIRVMASSEDIGKRADVRISQTSNWILRGEIVKIYD